MYRYLSSYLFPEFDPECWGDISWISEEMRQMNLPLKQALIYASRALKLTKQDTDESALVMAICRGEKGLALNLINVKAGINHSNKSGKTPLMHAAEGGDLDLVQALIEAGADVLSLDNRRQENVLFIAIRNRNWDVAKILIPILKDKRAINHLNSKSKSALDKILNTDTCYFGPEAFKNHQSVIEDLLNAGVDHFAEENNKEATKIEFEKRLNRHIMIALKNDHDLQILKQLIDQGADVLHVDSTEKSQNSLLMFAIKEGVSNEIFDYLILKVKEKGGLNYQNSNGCSALHFAVHNGDAHYIRALIDAGIDLSLLNRHQKNAFTMFCFSYRQCDFIYEENYVIEYFIKAVKEKDLLNIQTDDGRNALMIMLERRQYEFAEVLINNGIDLTQVDQNGDSALMYALREDDTKIVKILIQLEPRLLTFVNNLGETPSSISCKNMRGDEPNAFILQAQLKELFSRLASLEKEVMELKASKVQPLIFSGGAELKSSSDSDIVVDKLTDEVKNLSVGLH